MSIYYFITIKLTGYTVLFIYTLKLIYYIRYLIQILAYTYSVRQ